MIKSLSPQYQALPEKSIMCLLLLASLLVLHTCNNTDGNKLVTLFGIALYYGDTYIILFFQASIPGHSQFKHEEIMGGWLHILERCSIILG